MLELSGKYNKEYTYNDLMQLEEGTLCELINGVIEMSPSPSSTHQWIIGELYMKLRNHLKNIKLNYKILLSPLDVKVSDRTVLQPDMLVISEKNKHIIRENGIFGPPDIVIEVLSKGNIVKDRYIKKEIYQNFGVQEYWMIDSNNETIEILILDSEGVYNLYSSGAADEKVKSQVLEKFEFCFDDVKPDAELFKRNQ